MTSPQNKGHAKPGSADADHGEDLRDLQRNNEVRGAQTLPPEEAHDVHEAGGGTVGGSQGGAHTGRYGASPGAQSNRESKPRGDDKE